MNTIHKDSDYIMEYLGVPALSNRLKAAMSPGSYPYEDWILVCLKYTTFAKSTKAKASSIYDEFGDVRYAG